MNSKSMFLIMAMAAGTLSSCVSNEDVYDPEKAEAMKLAKYEAAFVKKYGKVDPKQDWGFGEAEIVGTSVTTRFASETDGKNWYTIINYEDIPAAVTSEEEAKVLDYFDKLPKDVKSISIKWSDYFIQPVHKGTTEYTANNNGVVKGSEQMNELCDGTDQHIGDFNGGDWRQTTDIWAFQNDNDTKRKNEKICLVKGGNTSDFGYKNSTVGGEIYNNRNFNNRVSIIQEIDGAYYVGLQFFAEGEHSNQQVKGNDKYTDWIVKITPAKYKNARRIMAEDLAVDNNSDFDFNDVVFDAAIVGNDAVITLQAVGGTLPLHIGTRDDEHEVHKLFGVEQNVFVNTVHRGEKAPVMFRLTNFGGNKLDDIAIYVDGQKIGQQVNVGKNAPAKLCCPTKYDWAPETISIEDGFPSFKEAVGNHDIEWYEGGNESE